MAKVGYDALMHVVCVEWGFCGSLKEHQPLHVDLFIPPDGPVTADQFVEWVFLAENMNPKSEPDRWQRHREAIRAAFVEHMEAEVVDASKLRWSSLPTIEVEPDPKYRGQLPDQNQTDTS